MPSPFPGMDPYLESPTHWSDFHHRFISALSEAINDRLPDSYVARIDEHVMAVTPMLHEESDGPIFLPDVSIVATAQPETAEQPFEPSLGSVGTLFAR